jgi:plasmid replication initiation protein
MSAENGTNKGCTSKCEDGPPARLHAESRRKSSIVRVPVGLLCIDRRTLSSLEDFVFFALLRFAKLNLQQDCHRIRLADLARAARFSSRNFRHLQNAIGNLSTATVEWDLLGKKAWGSVRIFDRIEISRDSAGLWIVYAYDNRLRKRLDEVPYTVVDLETLWLIRGKYARRLYLMAKSAAYRGCLTTNVAILRCFLGIPDGAYATWKQMRKNIITSAIQAVNAASDLRISYKARHDNNSGVSITLAIKLAEVKKEEKSGSALKQKNKEAALWRTVRGLQEKIEYLEEEIRRRSK